MKRKPNPLRGTVTNWISGRPKVRKSKITLLAFFKDLENRGPINLKSDKIFTQWTKMIRKNMQKAGTWINEDSDPLKFVQEYISLLQAEFWKMNSDAIKDSKRYISSIHTYIYYHYHELKYIQVFKLIYSKVRVFGLRQKLFYLQKHKRSTLGWSCIMDYGYGKIAKENLYFIENCDEDKLKFIFPFVESNYFKYGLPANRYRLGKFK